MYVDICTEHTETCAECFQMNFKYIEICADCFMNFKYMCIDICTEHTENCTDCFQMNFKCTARNAFKLILNICVLI